MGAYLNDAMKLYSKFRDDLYGLDYEFNQKFPYLLGVQYFCKGISQMNKNLPSRFDLLPIKFSTQQLKDLLFEIKIFAGKLQLDLYYEPETVKEVVEELSMEIQKWEARIKEISALKHSRLD
jgi:hypothetical protein